MVSILFLLISGSLLLHSENAGQVSSRPAREPWPSMSTPELFGPTPVGHRGRLRVTDISASTAAPSTSPFNPSCSSVSVFDTSPSPAISFSSEAMTTTPKLFYGNVQSILPQSSAFQQSHERLTLDEVMLQPSKQDISLGSEKRVVDTKSLSLDTFLPHSSEFSLISNTGVFQVREEVVVSGEERFVMNHASSLLGTLKSSTVTQTLFYNSNGIEERRYSIFQTSHQTDLNSDTHKEIMKAATATVPTEVLLMSTDETLSPSHSTGSEPASVLHIPAARKIIVDTTQNAKHLPTAKKMSVVKLREDAGFITTPRFGNTNSYPNNIQDEHCFQTSASGSQTLLLSFPYFDLENSHGCRYDYLEVLTGSVSNRTQLWKKCGHKTLPAEVITQPVVCLRFISDQIVAERGFNVTYSFLPKPSEEYQLADGFNCTNIGSFHRSLHFDCNLALECHDKQDETNCSYSSKECPGLVDAGSKCYMSKLRSNLTWSAASTECTSHHQVLVSPQSLEEWNTFVNITGRLKKNFFIYFGLKSLPHTKLPVYRNAWLWSTNSVAFYLFIRVKRFFGVKENQPYCLKYIQSADVIQAEAAPCSRASDVLLLCESPKSSSPPVPDLPLVFLQTGPYKLSNRTVECPSGHLVRSYLECDFKSRCHDISQEECVLKSKEPRLELFPCLNFPSYLVHYTLLCDNRLDCPDASDESFCTFEQCPEDTCKNGQCISYREQCDGIAQCSDGSDENCETFLRPPTMPDQLPVIVDYNNKGIFTVRYRNKSTTCPDTHFQCHNMDCLPVFLRCNRINDCPDHEDEHQDQCEQSSCPGFFRCRDSNVCVHPDNVCDGVSHCPENDDEVLCHQICPPHCSCQGYAFICSSIFVFSSYQYLRYLHIDSSLLTTVDLTKNIYLVLLRLSNCKLKTLSTLNLGSLHNLYTFDLRNNFLASVQLNDFDSLYNLRSLVLSGNPLTQIIPSSIPREKLTSLDLSHTLLGTINNSTLLTFPKIQTLNLSNSAVCRITREGLNSSAELKYLDLTGTVLRSYPMDMLLHLSKLKEIWANDFKMCCKAALPEGFDLKRCHAPQDNIASCDDLLRSTAYKTFLWIIAVFSLLGNIGSFVSRLLAKECNRSSFAMFVMNLSLSDFLMGVYLTMIGVADEMFRGQYWWRADLWKHSAVCKMAGFLSLLSSEVSAFFICLITLDRFLVLRFPFSRFHFNHRSTLMACVSAWISGLILAGVPLLPLNSEWDFYGQTGICLPLPFTNREAFSGYFYSFSVMIVLNFVLFMLIALGQVIIYWSVTSAHKSHLRKHIKSSDVAIARRLIAIVLSDFMCWFPTGILGLWAFTNNTIHNDINVSVAIFVMPFNAALNPLLYTFNMVMEKRRKAAETRMMLRLQATLHSEITQVNTQVKRQSLGTMVKQTGRELHLETLAHPSSTSDALYKIDKWLKEGTLSTREVSSLLETTKT